MAHRARLLGLTLLAGIPALTGCVAPVDGAGEDDDEAIATTAQRIMGGTADATDVNVVDIIWSQGGDGYAECSGSLLAPNMVLTAHHCVSAVQNEVNGGIDCAQTNFGPPASPGDFYVSTEEVLNLGIPSDNDFHEVVQVVVPPDSTNTTFCGVDQAILILADNVQPSEAVPLVPRVDSQIANKDPYTAIGFGGTVQDGAGAGTRRRLGGLHVDCVGSSCTAGFGGTLDVTHEWIGDHGTCEGDSGGPALDAENRVIGVTSRGQSGCESPVYGSVYDWAAWIKQTAQQAAQLGGYDAPPWVTGYPTDPAYGDPVGGACGASCASGLTLDDAEGCYCTRLCEAAAPCPSGYTCTTLSNVEVCERNTPATMSTTSSSTSSSGGTSGTPGPSSSSGCNLTLADPTKPVPWIVSAGLAALARRRRRRS